MIDDIDRPSRNIEKHLRERPDKFTGLRNYIFSRCLIAAVTSLSFFACGCSSHRKPSDNRSGHLARRIIRRGLDGEPATLDPAKATDSFSFEVLRDVYEGLTTESPTGEIIPGIAESWRVNSTNTKYTFRIRPDARWSNGLPVTPQEFVTAWRRVVDPKTGSPVADALRPIANAPEIIAGHLPPSRLGVHAIGRSQLQIILSEPCPYFLQLLTHTALFPVYSTSSAKSHSPDTWVSDGAYRLGNWVPGEQISLERNRFYWDRTHVLTRNIEYVFTPDEGAALREFLAGQLDITDSVPLSALGWVKRHKAAELHVWPFLGVAYYAVNLHDPRIRMNLKLREAMAMAIDRKILISRVLRFGQIPAYSFVPPGTWNYTPQPWNWKSLSNLERITLARKLFREAGYSPDHPLKLRLLINTNSTIKETAIAIAAMWQSVLGIQTEINEQEYRVFLQSRRDPTQWDIARLGWTADYDDASDFLDIFRQHSPNNDPGYANSAFTDLMNLATHTSNVTTRRRILEAAERMMLSDYPVIPIYFYASDRLVKPYIGGFHPTKMNRLYSRYLYFRKRTSSSEQTHETPTTEQAQ